MPLVITLSTDAERPDLLLVSSKGLDVEPRTKTAEHQTALDEEKEREISLIEDVSLTMINDPQTLSLLAAQMATPSPLITLTTTNSQPYALVKTSLKNLRISLLAPLSPFVTYTESEHVGEAGPTTLPLIQSWREAYQTPRHREAAVGCTSPTSDQPG